jgi:uncharacterized protein YcnI
MQRKIAAAVAAGTLAAPAAAGAHVTLQPDSAAAGDFTVENVRVPNERDDASTVKVDLQLPPGFVFVSYAPRPGWTVKVTREKLAKPIQTDDGRIDEEIRRITFTGRGAAGRIGPGQFMDFPLSVQIPGKPGDKLTFKAIQTYSGGEVVRWIGVPGSETPAPVVEVTGGASQQAAPAAAAKVESDGGASKGLGIAALAVGILALLVGLGAFALGRRRLTAA